MKILKKDKSKLIDRVEVLIEYQHIGKPTPSTNEIKKEISNELKAKEELVIVKDINTKFGEGNSLIRVHVYDNLEELKKLEKYEEPKKEEAPIEESKEEKPSEEVKVEETPKEKPKEEIKEDGKETKTEEQTTE
jgi:ribosomal protein S24E